MARLNRPPYKGIKMKIKIGDQTVIIDDEMHNEIAKYKWFVRTRPEKKGRVYFATQNKELCKKYKLKMIPLHRFIMGIIKNDGRVVDHINRNTWDCRKENMRICTRMQNACNTTKTRKSETDARGVHWNTGQKKYYVYIRVNKKKTYIGRYDDLEIARKSYITASLKYHGEYSPYSTEDLK
jgi:hypothetical protein